MGEIIAIFTNSDFYTKEKIINFEPLKKKFIEIGFLNELRNKEINLNDYKVIIDGTDNGEIYNVMLEQKRAKEIKEGFISYLLTPNKKIITRIAKISSFFAGEFNDTEIVLKNVKKTFEDYNNTVEFAYSKIPRLKNYKNFNLGMEVGIDITDFIENITGEKKYKLVNSIPDRTEANTEYITPEGISIIKDFLSIKEVIR